MKITLDDARIRLVEPARMHVRDGSGQQVCCFDGNVWITQEGDARDVFLHAGECFTLDRGGLAIISALGATELQLRDTGSSGQTRSKPARVTPNARS